MPRHANDASVSGPSAGTEQRRNGARATALIGRLSARLAGTICRARRLLQVLTVVSAMAFVVTLVTATGGNGFSLVALLALVWLSFLLAYGNLMAGGIPAGPPPGSGVLAIVIWRLRQMLAWCMIVVMVALALVLVFFTLRAVSVATA